MILVVDVDVDVALRCERMDDIHGVSANNILVGKFEVHSSIAATISRIVSGEAGVGERSTGERMTFCWLLLLGVWNLVDAGSSGEVGGLDMARSPINEVLIGEREVNLRRAEES